jgi:poly(A) polymerase
MTPPAFLTDAALIRVWDALPQARVVGGAVRDTLAGRAVADIDLATPQSPDDVMLALRQAGLKVVPTGLAHGTVTAVSDRRGFEITTLRRDVETDGRHAVVAFTQDWQLDAARRDFTINAMSMTRDGTIHDYFGGTADVRAGRIRFVGDPTTRIAEDYLRILRFFRFYARYAHVPPEPATLEALRTGVFGLARLSVERVWTELRRILAAPDPVEAVGLMQRLGIWAAVLPEAAAVSHLAGLPPDPILRLAAMLTADPLATANRLKMSHEERDRLIRLLATPSPGGSDADLRRLLADHLPKDLIARTWLDGTPGIRDRLVGMQRPVFPLEGRHVVAMGVPAGPQVGVLLRDVRRWWMDGGCIADAAACLAKLAHLVDPSKMDAKR